MIERTAWRPLLAAAIAASAAACWRVLPASQTHTAGRIELMQGDSDGYEHARRTELALSNPPSVPAFDSFANAPYGAAAYWSPLFDQLAAGSALVLGGGVPGRGTLERLYLWFPVALGALACAVLAAGLWGVSPVAAAAAAAALAVLPAHRAYSAAARFDHHALEALFFSAWLVSACRFSKAREAGRAGLAWGAALALSNAALAATWGGGLLLWGALTLWLAFESAADPAWVGPVAGSAAAFHAYCALAGGAPGAEPLSFYSGWPAAAAFGWSAALAGAAGAWLREARARGWGWGRAAPAAVCAAAACAWLLRGPALQAWRGASSFLGVGSVRPEWIFYGSALESFPLFRDPRMAWVLLGPGAFLAPLLLLPLRSLRAWPAPFRRILAFAAICSVALAFSKARFMYLAAVAVAVLEGAALSAAWQESPLGTFPKTALALGAFLALHGRQLGPASSGRLSDPARAALLDGGFSWLRDHSPAAGDFDRPYRPAAYSVLCDWGLGHAVKYLARRPVVSDAMGRGTRYWEAALAESSDEGLDVLLARRRVRYLFLTPVGAYVDGKGPASRGALARLFWGEKTDPDRFRLAYESPELRAWPGRAPTSPLKIYERLGSSRSRPSGADRRRT